MTRWAKKGQRRADVDPEPMSDALERFTSAAGLTQGLAMAKMRANWESIVGPILAPRCRAEKLTSEGVLRVSCDHGVTANEISMLAETVAAAARQVAQVRVESLDVFVRRVQR